MKTRLTAVAATAALAALALSSCSTVSNDAASVGGTSLSVSDFEHHVSDLSESQEQLVNPNGSLSADIARSLLTEWVKSRVLIDAVEADGESVTDDDRAEATSRIEENPDLAALDQDTKDFLIEIEAATAAFTRTAGLGADAAREAYDLGPSASGLVCLRGFIVATEEDAQAALDRIVAGEDFGTVAVEVSPDAAEGGIVVDQATGSECFSTSTLNPAILESLDAVAVGTPTAPIDLQGAWAVVLQRPFDEVQSTVEEQISGQIGAAQLTAAVTDVDGVSVNSRYGRWDPSQAAVVALS